MRVMKRGRERCEHGREHGREEHINVAASR